jgi:hypothetical protein
MKNFSPVQQDPRSSVSVHDTFYSIDTLLIPTDEQVGLYVLALVPNSDTNWFFTGRE